MTGASNTFLCALILTCSAAAEERGVVTGRVVTEDDAPLAGAGIGVQPGLLVIELEPKEEDR